MSHRSISEQKVFCIGISRTGTTSLIKALRLLDYKTIHNPLSIIRIEDGKLVLKPKVVARYEALADSMVAIMYKELDSAFPGSKFILTVRDVDSWIISMRRVQRIYPILRLHPLIRQICLEAFGKEGLDDEEAMKETFLKHNREVLEYFQERNDLLIMNFAEGDGWEKLCGFLDKPVPDSAFPHSNKQSILSLSNFWDTVRTLI